MRTILILFLAMTAMSGPAFALDLAACDRITRGWNGGERGHEDLGAGRVAFGEYWSQEGEFVDLVVTDCATGESLRTRTREARISDRPEFDRTRRALAVIDRHARRAPALFGIGALGQELGDIGEDTVTFVTDTEFCACAALYPAMRGGKTAFEGI